MALVSYQSCSLLSGRRVATTAPCSGSSGDRHVAPQSPESRLARETKGNSVENQNTKKKKERTKNERTKE
jgi:hypothetical protein